MSVQQHCVDTIQQTSQCLKNVGLKTIQNSQSRVSKMRELGPNIHQCIIVQVSISMPFHFFGEKKKMLYYKGLN